MMSNESEIKRHIDCDWLIEMGKDSFQCCDGRGALKGEVLSREEAHKSACEFIHFKNKQKTVKR
jgi:hypothetical protein